MALSKTNTAIMLCCSLPTFWHYLISKEKHALGLCMSRFLCFTSPKNDSWFHITCLFDLRLLPCSYLALVSTNDLWDLYPALLANKSKASHLLKYCIAIVFQVNWDSPRHCKSFYRGSQVWQIAGNNRSFIFGSMTVQIHSQMLKKKKSFTFRFCNNIPLKVRLRYSLCSLADV